MLESFLVALRVVVPMAILMAVGALVRTVKIVDRPTMRSVDKLAFRLFMPVLLFKNIYETDLAEQFNGKEMLFAAVCLVAIFLLALLLPRRVVADGGKAAAIGQAVVRSNYILFGIAVAESIYGKGNVGMVALLGAMVVPMTNIFAVVILELNRSGKTSPGKMLVSILKNPMVIAALLALGMKLLRIQLPELVFGVVKDIAGVTTTISFISLGVSLNLGELKENRKPLALGIFLRMLVVPLIFLPLSVALGFRDQALCALMILFAAPTAVASYPMAVAMGADGPLAGQLVCVTTVISVVTMFIFTFLLRSMGLL